MAEKDYTNHYLGTFSSNSAPSNRKIQLKQCPQCLVHLFKINSAPSNKKIQLKQCPQPLGHLFKIISAPSNRKIQLKQCPQHLGHLFKIISAPSNIRLKLKLCPQPIDGHFQLDSAPSRSNLQLIQCPQLLASAPSNKTSSQSCAPSYWLVPLAKLTPAKVVPLALQLISAPSRSNLQLIQCPQLLASAPSNGSLQLNQCPQHLCNFYGPNGRLPQEAWKQIIFIFLDIKYSFLSECQLKP